MTDYKKLVEALRILQDKNSLSYYKRQVCKDAADAIEKLVTLYEKAEIDATNLTGKLTQAEAQLTDYAAAIEALQAEVPKRGEWELIDGAEPMRWGCSRCKYLSWETSNYCPNCGAKMEVQE